MTSRLLLKEWIRLAEGGNRVAQNNLCVMYRNGWGVSQNYKEAVRWYRLAAEQGHAMAQSNLGVMYRNGEGVLADFIIAHMWFSIAANNGNELAAENREKLEKRITLEDISKAQAMARICMCRILIALLMTLAKHTAAETFEGKEAEMLIRKGKILSSVPIANVGMQLLVATDGRLHLCTLNAPASFSTDTSTSSLESLKVRCVNSKATVAGNDVKQPDFSDDQLQSLTNSARAAIRQYWWILPGSPASKVALNFRLEFDKNGNVRENSVKLISSKGGDENAVRTAFRAAMTAIKRASLQGAFKLPSASIDGWEVLK